MLTEVVIRSMGIPAIGEERDPRCLGKLLAEVDDETWTGVTDLFLAAHYPPRLFAIVTCPDCGARNDVDAPYDREFEPSSEAPHEEPFVSFDDFDAMARSIAAPLLEGSPVTLVVEGGVAACDDGGEPLLGAYVPAHPGSPWHQGEVTVYYRTFASMWVEDGAYDVEAELRETIEHELDHHHASLTRARRDGRRGARRDRRREGREAASSAQKAPSRVRAPRSLRRSAASSGVARGSCGLSH